MVSLSKDPCVMVSLSNHPEHVILSSDRRARVEGRGDAKRETT
jgi:hypothetical protein